MRIIFLVVTLLIAVVVSAATASDGRGRFPFHRQFVATSLNGERFDASAPTFTVTQSRASDKASAGGSADCNSWGAEVKIDQNRFSVDEVFTTAVLCSEETVLSAKFLEGLKAVKRWRLKGLTLTLEGDRVTIMLRARR